MPIVALSSDTIKELEVTLKGYPILLNQEKAENIDKTHIYMNDSYEIKQKIVEVTD